MKKVMFKINDMHCPACVLRLEGIEDDLEGVLSAKASFHKQSLEVEYDEAKTTPAVIQQTVSEMGYASHLVE
ncbi:MAG: cation transporter [Anaerolineaceae bacterium]|nr:cation transporter [Anaerolineaceae bacterium]